jgi:hypothetical protein
VTSAVDTVTLDPGSSPIPYYRNSATPAVIELELVGARWRQAVIELPVRGHLRYGWPKQLLPWANVSPVWVLSAEYVVRTTNFKMYVASG